MLSSIREVAGENPLRPCAASLIFLFSRPFAIPFLRSLRLLAIGIGYRLFSHGLTPTSSKWINKSAGS
jgi:hypothetical protein